MDYKVLLIFNLCFYKIKKTSKSTEPPGDVRDADSIPWSGRSPREGNGNPLQDSHLENPMDRGAWRGIVYGVSESDMTEHVCVHIHTHTHTHTHTQTPPHTHKANKQI